MTPNGEANIYADFWRYEIGVNVIPAVNKKAIVEWKEYQDNPISEEQHNKWKNEGMFNNGLAVILGKVWHRSDLSNHFLVGIDCDNQKAIKEICTRNGQTSTLQELASMTLIEQHRNNPDKAHIYFYSTRPFVGKSSDKNTLGDKIESNEIPAFEIKSLGKHGIFVCANSMHTSGYPYEIIGTRKAAFLDEKHANEFESDIDKICYKYGIAYLNQNTEGKAKLPIEDLFKPAFTILEGHNRHEALLRVMETLIARNRSILEVSEIKRLACNWNEEHCKPALDNTEFQKQWSCAIEFMTKKVSEEEQILNKSEMIEFQQKIEEKKSSFELTSVSQAARMHSGVAKVRGIIAAMFKLNKLLKGVQYECFNCHDITDHMFVNRYGKPTLFRDYMKVIMESRKRPCDKDGCQGTCYIKLVYYSNGLTIELRDAENLSDIDPLRAILLDNDTIDAYTHLGEDVKVTGLIDVIPLSKQVAISHMFIDAIEYETTNEIIISSEDVKGIKRLVERKGNDLVDFLASKMFAPDIIGYNFVKKGILLVAASTNTDINDKKLNALLIGDPGLAKSELLRKAITLVPNSRYESAQNSSGKSLTAIVEKHDETSVLRIGVVPAAKGGICALNEIGRMNPDDQKHLLDVAQEQVFTINKYGINSKIKSPTAIIGSANPVAGQWLDNDRIDLDEIPAIKPLIDRLDLLYIFRKPTDMEEIRNYAIEKSKLEDRIIPDYTIYLRKHIEYSKRFKPKLSDQANFMLTEYYVNVAETYGSPRVRESVFKIAKMIARLKLKNTVDADEAKEAMELYNVILQQLQHVVNVTSDPRNVAYNECVKVILECEFPILFVEIVKTACQRNDQVKRYIGDKYDLTHNFKLRPIVEMLLNNSNIKQVSKRPLSFVRRELKEQASRDSLLYDVYDVYDGNQNTGKTSKTDDKINLVIETPQLKPQAAIATTSYASYTSHRSKNSIEQSTLQQQKAKVLNVNETQILRCVYRTW